MRQEQDYCQGCGNPIEVDMIGKTNICGSCAVELRVEEDTKILWKLRLLQRMRQRVEQDGK